MGVRLAQFLFLAAAVAAPGCAAVTGKPAATGECRVVGASKLPAPLDRDFMCAEIARAMAAQAPKARYDVEVKVQSAARLAALLVVNGRTLPSQNMAVSDGRLSTASLRRFAETLAGVAGKY